jgi:hypothetical protein
MRSIRAVADPVFARPVMEEPHPVIPLADEGGAAK